MEEIEVIIKLSPENIINYLSIRKSDTILKLKEYCQIISKIPPDQQNLLYKGKILVNENLISDYNIENNHEILLLKKGDQTPENAQLNQNSNFNLNETFLKNNNINISNNKEMNFNEVAKVYSKLNLDSFINNIDFNGINSLAQSFGIGKISDLFGIEPQKMKEKLNDPTFKEIFNNIGKDPSLIEMAFDHPKFKEKIINNPALKFGFQNLNALLIPKYFQMAQNILPKQKQNENENNGTTISNPPEPFGNLNNNQINQIMDFSSQVSNINNFNNNNNTENKDNFKISEINIDYKEKYKEQLSQIKNMGFTNEEANIQVLK